MVLLTSERCGWQWVACDHEHVILALVNSASYMCTLQSSMWLGSRSIIRTRLLSLRSISSFINYFIRSEELRIALCMATSWVICKYSWLRTCLFLAWTDQFLSLSVHLLLCELSVWLTCSQILNCRYEIAVSLTGIYNIFSVYTPWENSFAKLFSNREVVASTEWACSTGWSWVVRCRLSQKLCLIKFCINLLITNIETVRCQNEFYLR